MLRILFVASVVLILAPTKYAAAESCDAGHGCSVDCSDGCSAVYYQDTDQCVAVCYDSKGKKKATSISATIKNAAKADIERLLRQGTKAARPQK